MEVLCYGGRELRARVLNSPNVVPAIAVRKLHVEDEDLSPFA
jgi:hypothetical protein